MPWLEANATRKARTSRPIAPASMIRPTGAPGWQAKKAAAGYARITWPKEYGGMGGTPIQQVIYQQEESNFLVPLGFFDIGLGMCIPTMMAYATKDQLKRHVKPALFGEVVWCQLFSEPAAGSDVAGIRTKAERDGDDWIINGQKVWTSGAHYSDWGIIITRTDPNVPTHQGLTMFFLNMKSPGVEARPIKQITGGSEFNEVFFTNVCPRRLGGRRRLEGGADHADERAAGRRYRRAGSTSTRLDLRAPPSSRTGRRSATVTRSRSPTGTCSHRAEVTRYRT